MDKKKNLLKDCNIVVAFLVLIIILISLYYFSTYIFFVQLHIYDVRLNFLEEHIAFNESIERKVFQKEGGEEFLRVLNKQLIEMFDDFPARSETPKNLWGLKLGFFAGLYQCCWIFIIFLPKNSDNFKTTLLKVAIILFCFYFILISALVILLFFQAVLEKNISAEAYKLFALYFQFPELFPTY